jgi:multiple sugar transport system permease protein
VEDISQNGAWTIPRTFSLSNYVEATERLLPHYQASAITTIPSVLLACFIGAMAGYALSQLKFRGRNFVFLGLIAGGFVPIHVQLIPVFKLMNTLGLYDSYIGLISVHTMRSLSMAVLILTNFFGAVPKTLREAASIDGASEFKIFYKVFLPLTRPALAALFIFLFTWVWNDLLWGLVLAQSDNKRPITAGILSFQGEFDVQWPMLATGSVLATLPTVVVFLAFQRHFINGLTMGAVKG